MGKFLLLLDFFEQGCMRIFVDTIRPREQGEDTVEVDYWAEEDSDAWVVY